MLLRQRTTDWVTHTFREHKEADLWAGKGARGRAEWVDTTSSTWQVVPCICGTWDRSPDNYKCGCGIVFMALSAPHTDRSPFTHSVVLYQGRALWMLKWVDAGCLLTLYSNGWKRAHVESMQLPNQSTIEIWHCVHSFAVFFFFGCMRQWFQWRRGLGHTVVFVTWAVSIPIKLVRG